MLKKCNVSVHPKAQNLMWGGSKARIPTKAKLPSASHPRFRVRAHPPTPPQQSVLGQPSGLGVHT